jgi:uncharacterized protein DUF4153
MGHLSCVMFSARPPRIVARVPPRRALLVAGAGLAAGLLVQYLFVRERAGVNVGVATASLLALAWLVHGDRPARGIWAVAAAALALAFAGSVAVRTDAAVVWFDVLAALGFGGAFFIAATGGSLAAPFVSVLRRSVALATSALLSAVPAWVAAMPEVRLSLRRASPVSGYAAGFLLAVPFVVVFSSLFAAADAVFERSVRDLFELAWLRELLRDLPARTAVAMIVAWCATGAFAFVAIAPPRPAEHDIDRVPRFMSAEPLLVALVLIDVLFSVFVALQAAYLFGGRDTLAAVGVTYSAYGRRGFFELVTVSAIVGALLFSFDLIVRMRRRSYIVAALALLALTAAILASAAYRMALYQQAYGWSELRLYTFAAIASLGVALAIFAWAVVTGRMDHVLVPLVATAAAAALVVNVIGPSDFVARRNLERVIDPSALPADASRGLDVAYLTSLGDGAIPALFELAPRLPAPEQSSVLEALRVAAIRPTASDGWQSWNLDRERARSIVVRASGHGVFMR